jgi:hypothetical protein
MIWYAANIIEYLKYTDTIQDDYLVNENIVLVKAGSSKEAFIEAKR